MHDVDHAYDFSWESRRLVLTGQLEKTAPRMHQQLVDALSGDSGSSLLRMMETCTSSEDSIASLSIPPPGTRWVRPRFSSRPSATRPGSPYKH